MNYKYVATKLLPLSNCLRRHYACVIIKDNKIIGTGYNHSLTGCTTCHREGLEHNVGDYAECQSIHAEQMALLNSDNSDLRGSTLYLVSDKDNNPKPCPICQRMMDWAGVKLGVE